MSTLLLVPLEDVVVFPNMTLTLPLDVGDEERILLVPVHEGEYAKVGTVAEIVERVRLPGGAQAVTLTGLHRGLAGAASADGRGNLRVAVEERPDEPLPPARTRDLEREYRAIVEEILALRGDDGRISAFVRSITEPGALADTVGYSPDFSFEQKVRVLEAVDGDVVDRLRHLDAQAPCGVGVRGTGHAPGDAGEGDGSCAAGQADAIGHLGDGADTGEGAFMARDQKHTLLVTGVHRERHVHGGEDDGVVERYEQ